MCSVTCKRITPIFRRVYSRLGETPLLRKKEMVLKNKRVAGTTILFLRLLSISKQRQHYDIQRFLLATSFLVVIGLVMLKLLT